MTRSERFRWARHNAGLSQKDVEDRTYLTRPTVSKTENPKHDHLDFKFDTVYTLSKLYGVNLIWLMTGEEDK